MAQERLEIILDAETERAAAAIRDFAKNVGVQINNATSVYDAFDSKIKEVQASLKKASDPSDVARLTAQLNNLNSAFSDIKAGRFATDVGKVQGAVANANPTLVNFGRVLQDAPFGIIGIANNIDPLVSSFQSLRTQTGSAGGAFKALGATLLGPAGIAVGISAATSALIAFGPQIGRAISGIDKFEQAQIDAAGKSGEAFIQAQNKFRDYVKVVNDGTASLGKQNAALDGANKLLNEYGLKIDSVATLQKQGAQIGAVFAQIKQEEAKAQFLAAKAAEEYSKGLILQAKAQQGDILGVLGEFSAGDLIKTLFGGVTATGAATGVAEGIGNAFSLINKNQKIFQEESDASKARVDTLIAGLKNLQGVTESYGTKTKTTTKALKEQVNVLNEIANAAPLVSEPIGSIGQLNQEIAALRKQQQSTFDPAVFANYQKEIDAIAAKIKTIQGGGALPPVEGDAGGTGLGFLNNAFAQTELIAKATSFQEVMGAIKDNAEGLVTSGVDVVLSSVFNSLQNGDNVFEGLGQAVKGFVLQLIKAVAQALILNAILKAFNLGAPGAGSILSGLLGGRGGVGGNRAGGGMVLAGQAYTVGEFGAERFVPSTNGMIVPNDMGGGGGTLTATVSGNDLLFILNQAKNNRGRNFA